MTGVLSYQTLLAERPVSPCVDRTLHPESGLTYGAGPASYDVRLRRSLWLWPLCHRLASTVEVFGVPNYLSGAVADKSTWARRKVKLAGTFIDPGFRGHLTLEIYVPTPFFLPRRVAAGTPIAQVVFSYLDQSTDAPYKGKYQDQPDRPISAIAEGRPAPRPRRLFYYLLYLLRALYTT